MNYVGSDKQRYAEICFLYSDALQFENLFGTFYIEYATYLLVAYQLFKFIGHYMTGDHVATGDEVHLSELLFKSHATHQPVDKSAHFSVGIVVFLTARTHHGHAGQGDEGSDLFFHDFKISGFWLSKRSLMRLCTTYWKK